MYLDFNILLYSIEIKTYLLLNLFQKYQIIFKQFCNRRQSLKETRNKLGTKVERSDINRALNVTYLTFISIGSL